jgi:hypothetical protein
MRLGHGGRHVRQTGAMRSEKCVARRGRAWDGMRVIAVCFTRALQRCAGRTNMRFLLILQEVRAIGKTRNQFRGSDDLQNSQPVQMEEEQLPRLLTSVLQSAMYHAW